MLPKKFVEDGGLSIAMRRQGGVFCKQGRDANDDSGGDLD